jgi:ribonuclease T
MDSSQKEHYFSVDVETAGPAPSRYSLLSIGACLVSDPTVKFYVELQPVTDAYTDEAIEISRLDLARLRENGFPPQDAMKMFADWIAQHVPEGTTPVFVAFNAPFDWMFVADYFHRYLGHNPFGHKAIDIKAYFMGLHNLPMSRTGYEKITRHYDIQDSLPHNALEDALIQAQIFRAMLKEQSSSLWKGNTHET